MATLEQEEAQRQELATALAKLAEIKPQDLVREDVLGRDLSFATGVPYFTRNLRLFQDLAESNLDTVPHPQLNTLTSLAKQALEQFEQVKSFSLQKYPNNPTGQRDTLITSIREAYDGYFNHIAPIIAYSVRKGTDFQRLEDEARQAVDALKGVVADQEVARKAMLGELEGTLEKVRRAAQEVGVAQHAIHFKQEAEEHRQASFNWLISTAVLASVTIILAGISFFYYLDRAVILTVPQSIELALFKIVIFTVLFTATLWSSRNYRAHRHNFVINKHRQNALSTFETFAKAAGDDQTKAAVLLQATKSIFSTQSSGYVTQDNETVGYPQVLEIVRGMAGKEK